MAREFIIIPDVHGFPTYGIPFPEDSKGYDFLIAAAVNTSFTIPAAVIDGGYNIVLFSFSGGTDVFVRIDAAAEVPTAAQVQRAQQMNPQMRALTLNETTLNFISDTSSYVQLSFYTGVKL
jgi:hypothetical protein